MATLDQLRARLNGEIAVVTDGETDPWTTTVRNQAISDGYAELWRVGVWKDATQDHTTVDDQIVYALTTIRRLDRLEILTAQGQFIHRARGVIELDGTGTNVHQVRLVAPIRAGLTLRVRGWTAYKSVFSGGADTDDLPAEHSRIPLLKAKAILYRQQLALFARYGEKQQIPPEMNLTTDQIIAIIAAAEREFEVEVKRLSDQRQRSSRPRTV